VRHLDKIRKAQYKQSRLSGKSKARSLLDAGYRESTAYHDAKNNALVKTCEQELMEEVKANEITVEWVIEGLTKELLAPDAKAADRIRVRELLGKYLKMFQDAQPQALGTNIIAIISELKNDKPKVIDVNSEQISSISATS